MLAFSLLLSITVTVTNPQPTPRQAVPVVVPIAQNGKEINSAVIKGQPENIIHPRNQGLPQAQRQKQEAP